ncbi:hypothetical protein ACS0TY_004758 [Phlomoides rotata]
MLRLLTRSSEWKRPIADAVFPLIKSRFSSTASPEKRLDGKVALITGGASGLGKATARIFIHHGARVVIADINSKLGPQIAHELGPQAQFVECDVASEAQIAEAVSFAVASHGQLDIMCINAGVAGTPFPPSIVDLDLDEYDRVMAINVRGTMASIKHAARVMVPTGLGSILCTASISGLMGGLGPHPYTVSKFAIPGIVKSLASELCKSGVRINCISPSPIPTPLVVEQFTKIFTGATRGEIVEIVNGMSELKGAICEEVDVARAALFLASDEAKFITGHNLVVDGGFTSFKSLQFPKLS